MAQQYWLKNANLYKIQKLSDYLTKKGFESSKVGGFSLSNQFDPNTWKNKDLDIRIGTIASPVLIISWSDEEIKNDKNRGLIKKIYKDLEAQDIIVGENTSVKKYFT